MSKKQKSTNWIVKPKDDIGIDGFPKTKAKKPSAKTKAKRPSAKEAKITAKRRMLISILIAAMICGALSLLYQPISLIAIAVAIFIASLCEVGLIWLNEEKQAENYGQLTLANGATLLFVIGCYIISQAPDFIVFNSGYELILVLLFYAWFLLPTILFIIMSGVSIFRHRKSQHPTRALVLSIIGIILSIIAIIIPALSYII